MLDNQYTDVTQIALQRVIDQSIHEKTELTQETLREMYVRLSGEFDSIFETTQQGMEAGFDRYIELQLDNLRAYVAGKYNTLSPMEVRLLLEVCNPDRYVSIKQKQCSDLSLLARFSVPVAVVALGCLSFMAHMIHSQYTRDLAGYQRIQRTSEHSDFQECLDYQQTKTQKNLQACDRAITQSFDEWWNSMFW